MHNCAPPIDALQIWLRGIERRDKNYGHLLLEQIGELNDELVATLRPYFESAHSDAREVFHADIGIDLHPDAGAFGAHAEYPRCLPSSARRGLFGEVMAGLVTESYSTVGQQRWSIPIFLFRYHHDVMQYMFDLARDPVRQRQVFGRPGNDFIAISLDQTGAVAAFMAGEAKWRQTLTPGTVEELMFGEWTGPADNRVRSGRGVWFEISRGLPIPQGLRQLQRLLQERAPEQYAAAILSLDRVLSSLNAAPIPRTDLIIIAGDAAARREEGQTLLPVGRPPEAYTAGRRLQVVELVLRDGDSLIDRLYDTLWAAPHAAI